MRVYWANRAKQPPSTGRSVPPRPRSTRLSGLLDRKVRVEGTRG